MFAIERSVFKIERSLIIIIIFGIAGARQYARMGLDVTILQQF